MKSSKKKDQRAKRLLFKTFDDEKTMQNEKLRKTYSENRKTMENG